MSAARRDGLWLAGSFAMLAVSGLVINLIIAFVRGPSALGLFNLSFAFYIFASQFAVFGAQYAALYHVSLHAGTEDGKVAATASLMCAVFFSCVTAFAVYRARAWAAELMDSPDLVHSLAAVAAGLFFFSVNKVFLNLLNAHRRIKDYALGAFVRYGALTLGVIAIAPLPLPAWSPAAALPCAEFVTCLYLCRRCRGLVAWRADLKRLGMWVEKTCGYGIRVSATGVIVELNTRVDILILGCFEPDAVVGLYSFAALLAEGLGQLPMLGRVYNDPRIARLWMERRADDLRLLARRTRLFWWGGMACLSVLVCFLYTPVLALLPRGAEYGEAAPVLAVLLFGVTVSAGYVPLSGMLQQTGYPGEQSLQTLCVFLLNAGGNAALIPFWGIYGAAVGMALSQVGMVVILRRFVKRTLRIAI
ncbi:MAG: polysaccharide biosynthesis C-terminal domain-containing protein [Desulfovibrio sp.]|nr:polysaccharide biosynthesis C-terminal domain-containing protein [Desulfovibrio sp.]